MSLPRSYLFSLAFALVAGMQVAVAIEPDFLMDTDPLLQLPAPIRKPDPEAKALWLLALERPETDMQRMAAETIARAHEYGIPGLDEAIPLLEKTLTATTTQQAARFACARALIALDSRGSSDKLFEAAKTNGADLRQLVEPALAQWNHEPAKKIWIDRLTSPDARMRDLVLAVRCLGQVEEQSAVPLLFDIIEDPLRDAPLRLEAAAAVGRIASQGLESKAERFARANESPTAIDQLFAIHLLARHTSEEAKKLLIVLAGNKSQAVAAAALHRLNEIDSISVAVLADKAIKNDNPKVRLEAALACVKHPSAERIALLVPMLADAHPEIRQQACDGLWELSKDAQFNDSIRSAAAQILDGDRWQGQLQAAVLLGYLEHKPSADRLIELLDSPRTEVRITSAWALRKLAAPETLSRVLEKARLKTDQRQTEIQPGLDDQVAHLFEALGVMQAMEAKPLLMQYVPKNALLGVRSRGAAVWAIGRIHEGKPDAEIEDALIDRITDFADKPPEILLVKEMSAVALARMNAVDQAKTIRSMVTSVSLPVRLGVTLRWALKQLANEDLPPPEALPFREDDWFLRPLQN